MFKFLKDKLKDAFKKFSKEVDHESKEVEETVKELEDEAPAILKKKYPSQESKEHVIIREDKPELKSVLNKKPAKEEPVEEITFEETFEEEQGEEEKIEQEAVTQAAKDIPDIDKEVLKELEQEEGEEKAEYEPESGASSELLPDMLTKDAVIPEQSKSKPKKQSEELLDVPPPVEEVEGEVKEPEKKQEPKQRIPEIKPEVKEVKKGFFSRLKEKIIGKEKEPEEEGFEEETAISPQDQEIQELAKEIEQPPSPIEIEEPVKQVIEKKKEEIEVKPQKVDDELEELKQEGYHEISLEPPKRAVRIPEYVDEEQEEKRGFFAKIADVVTKTTLSEEKFEELFWELEVALMENNVAVEVIDKIKGDLKAVLVNKKIQRGKSLDIIRAALQHSIEDLFNVAGFDLVQAVRVKKPYIISFVGINGSGKTTTIAKIAHMLKMNNVSCIIAASDTFRAAAIQQLEEHAEKIGVKLIKHDYGADPAAVAFDAIKYAQAKSIDCVLIDTAGRLHSNTNLMDEMKKIIRIAKPDLKIFIGEAITGNDCIEQAKQFNKAIGIDGIILCKADVDDKGGAAISVSYVTGKPILYLGVGQRYADLLKFDKKLIMDTISF